MNRFALIMMLGLVSILAGCEAMESIKEEPAVLTLDKNEFEITSFGGQCQVTVTANYEYEVVIPDDCANWVRYRTSGAEKNIVTFIVSAYDAYDDRVAEIEIKLPGRELSETVTIVQKQKSAILLDDSDIKLTYESGTFSVKLSTNTDYEINISDSWIRRSTTKALVEEDIVFEVEENTSFDLRTSNIRFKSEAGLKTLVVTQMPQVNDFMFKVTHDLEKFSVPDILGKVFTSKILWGDGAEAEYSKGAEHVYSESGPKVVEVSFEGPLDGHVVTLNNIIGVKEIDLSGM